MKFSKLHIFSPLVFLLTANVQSIYCQQKYELDESVKKVTILSEDFSDNIFDKPLKGIQYQIVAGNCELICDKDSSWMQITIPELDAEQDYEIEFSFKSIENNKGRSRGAIVEWKDDGMKEGFQIHQAVNENVWYIRTLINNSMHEEVYHGSENLKKGLYNVFTIRKRGGNFSFFINSQFAGEWSSWSFSPHSLQIKSLTNTKTFIDRIRITSLKTDEQDVTPPMIVLHQPVKTNPGQLFANYKTGDTLVSIKGFVSDNFEVDSLYINNKSIGWQDDGAFSSSAKVPPSGKNTVRLKAIDASKNVSVYKINIENSVETNKIVWVSPSRDHILRSKVTEIKTKIFSATEPTDIMLEIVPVNDPAKKTLSVPDTILQAAKSYEYVWRTNFKPGTYALKTQAMVDENPIESSTFRLTVEENVNPVDIHEIKLEKKTVSLKGLALIIGNGHYHTPVKRLDNCINDAKKMAQLLDSLGLDTMVRYNLNKPGFISTLSNFKQKLKEGNYNFAIFYYSGHGTQGSRGNNHLIPILPGNLSIEDKTDVDKNCISMQNVIKNSYSDSVLTSVIIIDACRSEDLPDVAPEKSMFNEAFDKTIPKDKMIVCYATNSGNTSSAGMYKLSIYTQALLQSLPNKENDLTTALKETNELTKMISKSEGRSDADVQVPEINDPTSVKIYLGKMQAELLVAKRKN